jgi:thioesterase domain-containing protein
VDAVVLIDSHAPGSQEPAEPDDPRHGGALVVAFAFDLAGLLGIELAGLPPELTALDPDEALRRIADLAESSGLLPPGLSATDLTRRFSTFAANDRARAQYIGDTGDTAARLILFRAGERPSGMVRPAADLGWTRLAMHPVEIHELPGNHYSLLREPGVEILASLLRERLGTGAQAVSEHELYRSI